ncbi:hypothetical protein A3K63_02515 [Candidatus Micrarchaeota archaeon RBG_16_49_10]|nr:MAG: hypothetical protein A3K63_02515 [Candidatus Micrarchaeota archaeon RBG_16_49_10]
MAITKIGEGEIYKAFSPLIDVMGAFILKPCTTDNTYKIIPSEYCGKERMVGLLVEKLGAEVVADTKFLSILTLEGLKLSVSKKGEIMIREFVKEEDATRLAKRIMKALEAEGQG